mgnify:CR=1 FL=1
MPGGRCRDKKLSTIAVSAGVRHRQEALTRMLDLEALVLEFPAKNALHIIIILLLILLI